MVLRTDTWDKVGEVALALCLCTSLKRFGEKTKHRTTKLQELRNPAFNEGIQLHKMQTCHRLRPLSILRFFLSYLSE